MPRRSRSKEGSSRPVSGVQEVNQEVSQEVSQEVCQEVQEEVEMVQVPSSCREQERVVSKVAHRYLLIPHFIYFLVMLEGWENQHSPATGPGEATVSVGSSQYISVTWQHLNQNI